MPKTGRPVRQAAAEVARRYGVDDGVALRTARDAVAEGMGVEQAARLLYANTAGRLPLARCREAATLLPLRPRRVA